jgi:hypothetical protein
MALFDLPAGYEVLFANFHLRWLLLMANIECDGTAREEPATGR